MITKELAKTLLADYLKDLGINTEKNFSCISGTHEDKNPSMSLNKKDHYIRCFSCKKVFDIFDLVERDTGITDFKEKLAYIDDWYNKKIPLSVKNNSYKPMIPKKVKLPKTNKNMYEYFMKCHNNLYLTDYLTKRGITNQEILTHTAVGYDPNYYKFKAIIFPTSAYSCVYRNTDNTSTDRICRTTGKSGLFNVSALMNKDKRPIFVVEGETDCLSILQVGGLAIGLGGTGGTDTLIKTLKNGYIINDECLISKENIINTDLIIALDNDNAGRVETNSFIEKLNSMDIKFIVADTNHLYQGTKDANDSLLFNADEFSKLINYYESNFNSLYEERMALARQEYQATNSNAGYLDSFLNDITNGIDVPFFNTGFDLLDETLEGGIHEGLYCIGAISSLGKTTFALQIADYIAEQKQDVLIISLEMSRNELIAKSLSRETFNYCNDHNLKITNAKTVRDITTKIRHKDFKDLDKKILDTAIQTYKEYSNNIYIYEGIGDIGAYNIRSFVEKHIKSTNRKPVVFIDYLQILSPYDVRATDKTNTDKAVVELKRLSRDFNIPVIAISSFNRANYKEEVNMSAFKESGAIEYGSDVLIGLQFKTSSNNPAKEIDILKTKDPRLIELVILKNRNGAVQKKISYKYYPKYNCFVEEI